MINRNLAVTAALWLASSLTACAVGPNYRTPATTVVPASSNAEPSTYSAQLAQAQFWRQFGDDTLNGLVDDALAANHDLRIALGHLVEARALRRQAQFDLAPTVTAAGGYTRERFSAVESPTLAPF